MRQPAAIVPQHHAHRQAASREERPTDRRDYDHQWQQLHGTKQGTHTSAAAQHTHGHGHANVSRCSDLLPCHCTCTCWLIRCRVVRGCVAAVRWRVCTCMHDCFPIARHHARICTVLIQQKAHHAHTSYAHKHTTETENRNDGQHKAATRALCVVLCASAVLLLVVVLVFCCVVPLSMIHSGVCPSLFGAFTSMPCSTNKQSSTPKNKPHTTTQSTKHKAQSTETHTNTSTHTYTTKETHINTTPNSEHTCCIHRCVFRAACMISGLRKRVAPPCPLVPHHLVLPVD